ncbi:PREDICTED: protein FAR1-RELATED SEQUENCE 8-like [Fragaria vesca subsp. vesca]|uniref:protein FAR1-RELATED SEQUENCE 8-like n=1 Tax=Fragaria vesca subsp. vesca TaxID=101020 RepID=UPI0002C2FFBF|nr:PREDICTED: protein FAR1-RELATED SEQUENCE 8-like [Fragaria vesca subsp. vesca]
MDGNNTSQVPYVEEDDLIASNEVDLELDDRDILKTGMIFSCYGVMYDYCKYYAMKTGWAIRTRSNSKRDGALKYVQLVCLRAFRGKSLKESEPKSSQITGCSTRIRAVLNSDGEYKLTTICLEHNHHLCPEATRRIRQYRGLDQHSKHRFSSNQDAGVRPSKNIHAILTEKGGYANLGYTVKDAQNFINKRTTLKLQSGDADALHRYFIMMQKNNPEFFYSIDVDDEGRLRNVFWADARSRAACEDFGDVITFDTTCLTNKYDMPFAPFVGVNHHGQSILLGCGLLCDETTMSFIWLYEEWKKCMKGKSPNAIITDQCAAMKNAIVVVFPDAKHRW